MKEKLTYSLVCFLSGTAVGVCLLFTSIGPAVFFLITPTLALLRKQKENKRLLLYGGAFAVGLCMTAYLPAFTIRPAVAESAVFWIDLSLYGALIIVHGSIMTASLWAGHRIPLPKGCRNIAIALFWVSVEWLFGFGALAWPTARLSLALWEYPVFFRSANIGGQLFVSLLIVLVNALLADAILHRKEKRRWIPLSLSVLMLIGNLTYGVIVSSAPKGDIPIAVIQPGGTAVGENRGTVYNDALELTEQAGTQDIKLLLLSESVLPEEVNGHEAVQRRWGGLANEAKADLLVGGVYDGISTVFRYDASGQRTAYYQKNRQVPFFENDGTELLNFLPGKHTSVLTTDSGKVGVMICYESMFSDLARSCVKDGADLLFVPTNDSWFFSKSARKLHAAHGAYRAVETGRTLVQASVNGTTAVFDATGTVTAQASQNEKTILYAMVALDTCDTVYSHIGDLWLLIGLLAVGLAAVSIKIKKRSVIYEGK